MVLWVLYLSELIKKYQKLFILQFLIFLSYFFETCCEATKSCCTASKLAMLHGSSSVVLLQC